MFELLDIAVALILGSVTGGFIVYEWLDINNKIKKDGK